MRRKHYEARIVSVDEATNTFKANVTVKNDEGDIIEQYNGEWHYDDYYTRTGVMYDFENFEMVSGMNYLYRAYKFFGLPMTARVGSVGRWTL